MMMRNWILAPALASIALAALPASAKAEDANTASEQSTTERPAAQIAEMDWLAGEWRGTGIGGNPAGEAFSFAGDKQMVGYFWQLDEKGDVQFYELITVTPDGESLVMRLKHFMGDLTGWEEKAGDTALNFPLISRSDSEWVFGPVTFTQEGPDKLAVSVKVKRDDGSFGSFDFAYARVSSD